jgi:hypothetical protein
MPRSSGPKGKRTQNGMTKQLVPSSKTVEYLGPLALPKGMGSNDNMVTQLNYIGTASASGAGLLNFVLDSYAQASSAADWANLSSQFQEYRILSMKTQCEPWNKYNVPTTTTLAPVYTTTSRQVSTALTSLADVSSNASAQIHSPSARITRSIRMVDVDEGSYTAVSASPANADRMFIKFYSAGNSNSIVMYDYLTTIMIEFRGRR